MDINPSHPFVMLLCEVVDVLVARAQDKKMQDAFVALAYELPTNFAHDHIAHLFPKDYVVPLGFPLSMYRGVSV